VLDLVAFGDHTMERPNAKLHCEEYLGWTSNVFVDSGDLILFVKLGSACFAKTQASMRDDVNMKLLCIVDAMLVVCRIKRFPPYCDRVGKAMDRRTCVHSHARS